MGGVGSGRRNVPAEQRFFAKVRQAGTDPVSSCWVWEGAKTRGYSSFGAVTGRPVVYGHRWSWEFFNGPIPTGLHIDHLCRNTACVNPYHLDPVPRSVNTARLRRPGVTQDLTASIQALANSGLTQSQIAEIVGCNQSSVSRATRRRRTAA